MNFTIKQKMTALITFLLGVAVLVTGLMLFTFIKINSSLDRWTGLPRFSMRPCRDQSIC